MSIATDSLPPIDLDPSKNASHNAPNISQDEKIESSSPSTPSPSVVVTQISVDPWHSTGLRNRRHSNNNNLIETNSQDTTDTPSSPWPTAPQQMQILHSISSSSYDNEVFENDTDCPATRAAAAVQALACQSLVGEEDEDEILEEETPRQSLLSQQERHLCRMETTHTSHTSSTNLNSYNNPINTPRIPDPNSFPTPKFSFSPTLTGRTLTTLSTLLPNRYTQSLSSSTIAGFLALLNVTCANYMLGPMRDAAALAVGVSHIPLLTLASTVLALGSSVPVGWLFEAPDPKRRKMWKRMGLTRGETQGTSLALFYRVFWGLLWSYSVGFWMVERGGKSGAGGSNSSGVSDGGDGAEGESIFGWVGILFVRMLYSMGVPVERILDGIEMDILGLPMFLSGALTTYRNESIVSLFLQACSTAVNKFGSIIYIMFFLVVHLMKLHSLSLIWGVTSEAMEYEENAERRQRALEEKKHEMMGMTKRSSAGGLVLCGSSGGFGKSESRQEGVGDATAAAAAGNDKQQSAGGSGKTSHSALRLKRLGFVGFGGTLGGILGSLIASFTAHILNLSGLLILAAILLEISANLSIELGRIMQQHWEEQMKYASCNDLTSLSGSEVSLSSSNVDSSMKKSVSLGSMKRVASSQGNLTQLNNKSNSGGGMTRAKSIGELTTTSEEKTKLESTANCKAEDGNIIDDNSFKQRLLRGVTTILRSRLLMAIFTYNALYASTSVLLSFQRAELVVNRSSTETSAVSNTAFLAKINTASSVAVFALQASGLGALIASSCGQRGALALMPLIRLGGVILLGWWHWWSRGQPPDLILFLVIDEFTKVINFAIAKPVRENLWRGLSAEARYEAKPIVDTLANRWGGGSAAFLVSFISRIAPLLGLGEIDEKGDLSIFGFPPVLLLCIVISAWWTAVSADVGNIRRKIDLELKKQQ